MRSEIAMIRGCFDRREGQDGLRDGDKISKRSGGEQEENERMFSAGMGWGCGGGDEDREGQNGGNAGTRGAFAVTKIGE
jgi:hypothetical protein